jgi:hypothetical protein
MGSTLNVDFQNSFPNLIIKKTLWIPLKERFGVKGGPKTG